MKASSATICVISAWLFLPSSASAQEAKQCPPGKHWVRAHDRRAYTRADGTPISASHVEAHCHDDPPSFAQWNKLIKDSKLSPKEWPHPKEQQKLWTEEEKERLLEALSDLPIQLWLNTVKGVYRFQRSSTYSKNSAANRDGNVVIYDNAFDRKGNLARILAHELSHEYYRQMSDEKTWEYVKAADWRSIQNREGKLTFIPGRFDYVEEDGAESIDEDFSNNVEYFLFEPQKLRQNSLKIYTWIERAMGDKFIVRKGRKE